MGNTSVNDGTIDAVVIGGGPAGSAAATMLAAKGWRVTLLERRRFPRDHVGESLLPASMPILEELGAMPAVREAGFLTKWGATMVWGRDPDPWSWYFKETSREYPHAYQVWRPQFDQILLENARANGVDVREGHRAAEVMFNSGRASGVRFVSDEGHRGEIAVRFVVDASGQSALLASRNGARRWDPFFQNLAVYTYFSGVEPLLEPDSNNIFIEAYQHGWVWSIPLHTGWTSVGAVVDNRTGQEGIRRLGARAFLAEQLSQTNHTSGRLRAAAWAAQPQVVRDWSYSADRLAGPGYVIAGDAACFVDPLFSSGVHLALMSGVMAAAYAATALKQDERTDEAPILESAAKVYQELYFKEYRQFREMARLFYSSNLTAESYFWEARRITDTEEYSPRQSFIQAVAGQPPRGYERAVLERGDAPGQFISSVRTVESDRAERARRMSALRSDTQRNQLLWAVPRLADGVTVSRRPVLGAGEFVWGYTLNSVSQPEGTPCSQLVASLVSLVDGRTPVATLVERLGQGLDQTSRGQLETAVTRTVEILYIDGTIERLGTG